MSSDLYPGEDRFPDVTALNLLHLAKRTGSDDLIPTNDECPVLVGAPVFKLKVDPVPASYVPNHPLSKGCVVTARPFGTPHCGGVE